MRHCDILLPVWLIYPLGLQTPDRAGWTASQVQFLFSIETKSDVHFNFVHRVRNKLSHSLDMKHVKLAVIYLDMQGKFVIWADWDIFTDE